MLIAFSNNSNRCGCFTAFWSVSNYNLVHASIRLVRRHASATLGWSVNLWLSNISADSNIYAIARLCRITLTIGWREGDDGTRLLLVDSNSEVAILICNATSYFFALFVGDSYLRAWKRLSSDDLLSRIIWIIFQCLLSNLRSLKAGYSSSRIRWFVLLVLRHSRNSAAILQILCRNRNNASLRINSYTFWSVSVNLPLAAITLLDNNCLFWFFWTVKRIWLVVNHNLDNVFIAVWRCYSYVSAVLVIVGWYRNRWFLWFSSDSCVHWIAIFATLAWNELKICTRLLLIDFDSEVSVFVSSSSTNSLTVFVFDSYGVSWLSFTSNSGLIRLRWRVFSIAIINKWLVGHVYCYLHFYWVIYAWNLDEHSAVSGAWLVGLWSSIFLPLESSALWEVTLVGDAVFWLWLGVYWHVHSLAFWIWHNEHVDWNVNSWLAWHCNSHNAWLVASL